jgi:hypothetical protein
MSASHVSIASLVAAALVGGCASDTDPNLGESVEEIAAAPAGLQTVTTASGTLSFYPYTLENFTASPSDPINLVFSGVGANPRRVRAALFNLSGNRTGTPFASLTSCTWADAMGGNQVTYGNSRWAGSAIQLECGNYEGPFRFHLRMFQVGSSTLANAHFEILIPGTTQHQVLSWELAEQFVTVELQRAGILGGAPAVLPAMNQGPSFRTIPAPIYNGLPDALIALIGGPAKPATADVGIGNDGHTMSFDLATQVPIVDGPGRTRDLELSFNQAVPRPFCNAGPLDFVFAQSPAGQPIVLRHDVDVQYGAYFSTWEAEGPLAVTPINPLTSKPTGPTQFATVYEQHKGHAGPLSSSIETHRLQQASESPGGPVVTSLEEYLRIGVLGLTYFSSEPVCQ